MLTSELGCREGCLLSTDVGLGMQGKEALQAHVCYGQPGILAVVPGRTVLGEAGLREEPSGTLCRVKLRWHLGMEENVEGL